MKKTAALLLTLLLSLPLSISALAADYPDLDESHWAYDALIRAVSWGSSAGCRRHCAALRDAHLGTIPGHAGPCLLSDCLRRPQRGGRPLGHALLSAACEAGVLQADDFLPVASDKLDMPLLRRDAAVLLSRLLPQEPASPGTGSAFVDWETLPVCYREAVSAVSACGLISGMPDGSFQGEAPLLRADGAVLLLRLSDLRGGVPSAPIPEREAPAADLPASLPGEQSPSEDPGLAGPGRKSGQVPASLRQRRPTALHHQVRGRRPDERGDGPRMAPGPIYRRKGHPPPVPLPSMKLLQTI